ncbi:bacteriocin immunity protein [Larsenimonas salina]|uniref:bacteriocin immunity protein n=1 Tax=Larsenimonas salina TaxID=1295565 RepID=UPI0020736F46|nr:bacteriocin immunity protein [Larsenimonas salina]MCM5705814.1 bacteriocin immunity protein [Larsenimonas salina]
MTSITNLTNTLIFYALMNEFKPRLQDYTYFEYLRLVQEITSAQGSDAYQDALLENFIHTSQYPAASDLIYYSDHSDDADPERIVAKVIEWRRRRGLPLFKEQSPSF